MRIFTGLLEGEEELKLQSSGEKKSMQVGIALLSRALKKGKESTLPRTSLSKYQIS